MYLVSRFFSSPDVAFISYISLNFVFGLCTMLVTLLPRLLAIISKVQVSTKPLLYVTHKWDVCTRVHVCICLCMHIYMFIHTHGQDFFQRKNLCFKHSWFSALVYTVLLVTILNFNLFITKKKLKNYAVIMEKQC